MARSEKRPSGRAAEADLRPRNVGRVALVRRSLLLPPLIALQVIARDLPGVRDQLILVENRIGVFFDVAHGDPPRPGARPPPRAGPPPHHDRSTRRLSRASF